MGGSVLNVLRAGRLRYAAGLALQSLVRDAVRTGTLQDTLIVLEHEPVYTVGLRDKTYTFQDEAGLRALGADFHRTDRGGLITFHGPGQLVVYPIVDLRHFKPSVRWYISSLENTIIETCRQFGLKATTSIHTGVWVNDAKICALGVHASRYVTSHGLALNCNTDLDWFSHIVPCGIPDKAVTSLSQQLRCEITTAQALPHVLAAFQDVFQTRCLDLESSEVQRLQAQCKTPVTV